MADKSVKKEKASVEAKAAPEKQARKALEISTQTLRTDVITAYTERLQLEQRVRSENKELEHLEQEAARV